MIKEVALGPSAESKLPNCTSTKALLCISTSIRVLRAPKKWSKYFFSVVFNLFKYLDEITQATLLISNQIPNKYEFTLIYIHSGSPVL